MRDFVFAAAAAALTLGACTTPHRQVRTSPVPVEIRGSFSDPAVRAAAQSASIERYDDFTLGIVEFDDQGRFWDRNQLAALESEIIRQAREVDDASVRILVFVHGWRDDASVCDEHLACFRALMRSIAARDRAVPSSRRHLFFGIYAAWRGYSTHIWPFEQLTFLGRKNAATHIGAGDMTEFLTRCDRIRVELDRTSSDPSGLVIIGHSLGGTIVFEALANIFKARLAEVWPGVDVDGSSRVISGFGGLVFLVNPAFEAERWRPIHELASTYASFSKRQRPLLIVAASETDSATMQWFPIGQWFGTLFEKTRDSEERAALVTSIGNYTPFVTHHLARGDLPSGERGPNAPEMRVHDCVCDFPETAPETEVPTVLPQPPRDTELDEGWGPQPCVPETRLGPLLFTCDNSVRRGNPFWVVRVAPNVLHEHNGFYSPYFLMFLRRIIFEMEPH
jgi:hypothetical protein